MVVGVGIFASRWGTEKELIFHERARTCAKRERQAAGAVRRIKTRPGDGARSPSSCNRPERQQLERNYEPRPRRLTHIQRSHMILVPSLVFLLLCRSTIPRTLEKVSRSGRLFVRVCGF